MLTQQDVFYHALFSSPLVFWLNKIIRHTSLPRTYGINVYPCVGVQT